MNKQRRLALGDIKGQLSAIKDAINTIMEEEEAAFDAMPESLQPGEKGQASEAAISSMEDAASSLDEAIDHLETATA